MKRLRRIFSLYLSYLKLAVGSMIFGAIVFSLYAGISAHTSATTVAVMFFSISVAFIALLLVVRLTFPRPGVALSLISRAVTWLLAHFTLPPPLVGHSGRAAEEERMRAKTSR
jgi:hypothetical protein